MDTATIFLVLSSLTVAYALQKLLEFRKAASNVDNFPGLRTIVSGASIWGNVLPRIPGVSPGNARLVDAGFQDFKDAGWDAYAHISAWPCAETQIHLADPVAIKEATTYRAQFPKAVHFYEVLSFFGRNIVASEGQEWKRYRKVAAPAFSERNNKLVWDETLRIVSDLLDNVWKHAPEVTVDHAIDLTLSITLYVISVAGFGHRISWSDSEGASLGHKISFMEALHTASVNVLWKLVLPRWIMGLTSVWRETRLAYDELEQYMQEMIKNRRQALVKEERYDLLSSLLDATDDDSDGVPKLTDRELLGNVFIYLLAGHETSAHTLGFCFALLALYPDKQEKLYEEVKQLMPDNKFPIYDDMPKFTYTLAVLYETLRIRPVVMGIPKQSSEDTSLAVSNAEGQTRTIPIPKGTGIILHVPGLHNNPRYWDEPEKYKPERFLGDYNRDAFIPFSAGPRACLGRRFAETESVATIAMLVSNYRIEVKDDPKYAYETFEQRKARLLACKYILSTTPLHVPLTFKRRT